MTRVVDVHASDTHLDARAKRNGRRSIAIFVAVAYLLAWVIALPLWFGDGLAEPLFPLFSVAIMLTPTIAAVVVVLFVERPVGKARSLGLWPLKPVSRLVRYSLLGIFVPIVLVLVALPVGAALGVFPADFTEFSGFRALMDQQNAPGAGSELPIPIGTLIALQLLSLPLAAVVNLIPALGEEIGWRGWLLPKLMPLGTLPTILISGVIWGAWHAPVILLGYNYPDAPGWLALCAMIGMCSIFGAIFGWLRLRSGSVWPAALAHAAFNGAGGTFVFFTMANERVDTTQATMLGWSGWIVPLVLVVVLICCGQFRPSGTPPRPLRRGDLDSDRIRTEQERGTT